MGLARSNPIEVYETSTWNFSRQVKAGLYVVYNKDHFGLISKTNKGWLLINSVWVGDNLTKAEQEEAIQKLLE